MEDEVEEEEVEEEEEDDARPSFVVFIIRFAEILHPLPCPRPLFLDVPRSLHSAAETAEKPSTSHPSSTH